jgi:hypothetical protein
VLPPLAPQDLLIDILVWNLKSRILFPKKYDLQVSCVVDALVSHNLRPGSADDGWRPWNGGFFSTKFVQILPISWSELFSLVVDRADQRGRTYIAEGHQFRLC